MNEALSKYLEHCAALLGAKTASYINTLKKHYVQEGTLPNRQLIKHLSPALALSVHCVPHAQPRRYLL